MNKRMKFVIRLEGGERMSDLCREFGISRKTGYKIWNRYNKSELDGLFDESKRPITNPHQTSGSIERIIINLKSSRPTWGATKLREYLIRKHKNIEFPSRNTFHNILLKNDLVKKERKEIINPLVRI
jgi:transposase